MCVNVLHACWCTRYVHGFGLDTPRVCGYVLHVCKCTYLLHVCECTTCVWVYYIRMYMVLDTPHVFGCTTYMCVDALHVCGCTTFVWMHYMGVDVLHVWICTTCV